jgi:hypothetical protein
MSWQATRQSLDAGREHWQFGPIDLVLQAWGDVSAVARARGAAWERFQSILPELVAELAVLRSAVDVAAQARGAVAQRMLSACRPHAAQFITPMAAVAGAVADEICAYFAAEPGIRRAYVNNGGDIALHLREGESLTIGVIDHPQTPKQVGDVVITSGMPVRGVATSGWRGRSFSLGIADSVTVLAASAAAADAAATMIANAVNLDHPGIVRAPANTLKDDSDLGARLVTVDVPALPQADIARTLERGMAVAQACRSRGLIDSALLLLQGEVRHVSDSTAQARGRDADAALKLAA